MSKIEAGRFQIEAEPLELPPLVQICCDILRLKAQKAQVEIAHDVAPDLRSVVADERACRQIVLNLLSNAIKFTPKGGRVTLHARNDGDHLVLSVSDTGIGVSLADLPRLGDPFFQAKNSRGAPEQGHGSWAFCREGTCRPAWRRHLCGERAGAGHLRDHPPAARRPRD